MNDRYWMGEEIAGKDLDEMPDLLEAEDMPAVEKMLFNAISNSIQSRMK